MGGAAMTKQTVAARAARIRALFARHGEDFTLVRAGASRAAAGLFAPMDLQTLGLYFDGNESVGLQRPALSLYAEGGSGSDPAAASDLFYRDGRLYTVRKTHVFRFADVPLLVLALCD